MKIVFDTSILVAGIVEAHPHHARARVWLEAVANGTHEGMMSWHAVAEAWAVLTRLPKPLTLSGEQARLALAKLHPAFARVDMDGEIYEPALLRCCAAELWSGAVFDAIHLVVAEKVEADLLLTFNVKDFRRLAVGQNPGIAAPPDPPGLDIQM